MKYYQGLGFCFLLLFIAFFSVQAQNTLITLDSSEVVYNHGVGSSWSFSVSVNGREFFNADTVRVTPKKNQVLNIVASVAEDDSFIDIGSKEKTIKINHIEKQDSLQIVVPVTIMENKYHKYKEKVLTGKMARWKFYLTAYEM